jgi:hypothetical protein
MGKMTSRFLGAAACLVLSAHAWGYDLSGTWTLQVEDQSHKAIASLTVQFTNEQDSRSCISGKWMKVKVVSATAVDQSFYPLTDPLSYEIAHDRITIGRNGICDAYLMLDGPLKDQPIRGGYYSLGLGGSRPKGFFTLGRNR